MKELGAHTCKVKIGSAYQRPIRRMDSEEIAWQERLLSQKEPIHLGGIIEQVIVGAAIGIGIAIALMNILVR